MTKLTQLANGHWIDLTTVTGLTVWPAIEGKDEAPARLKDRLAIWMGPQQVWVAFPTRAEAVAERDRLAELVNQVTDQTDARLSNAAPNLLVALTELVGVCRELEAFDGRVASRVRYLTRAEAAIAKATKP